ncbi:MAG: ankyrin repeat domain-containing protein, partial [Verrucomicrobiia bacterium]
MKKIELRTWGFVFICTALLGRAFADASLADAVESRDSERIQSALSGKVDIDASQVDGMTALHWAAYHDNWKIAKELLAKGANPVVQNRYGITPLYLACVNGNANLVKALIDLGADANTEVNGGETVLMTASRTGKVDAVVALIDAGADVDATERSGQSAMMWAAAEGHVAVVRALLDAGADFQTPLGKSGYTPFFFSVREGNTQVVRMLLEAGVDVNAVMHLEKSTGKLPKNGTSPLLLAVENGHYDLAIELLDLGADPNDDRSGFTILHTLTWIRKPDIGESANGDPAPHGSGRRNSDQFIREIVKRGADVNARLKRGRKA